jgi:hypothetical protein
MGEGEGVGEGLKGGAELKFMNANFCHKQAFHSFVHIDKDNYSNVTVL